MTKTTPSVSEPNSLLTSVRGALVQQNWKGIRHVFRMKKGGRVPAHILLKALCVKLPVDQIRLLYFEVDQITGDCVDELEELGHSWFELDCFAEAEQSYRRAIVLESSRLNAILGLANCLLVFARFDEVRSLLENALTLWPDNPSILGKLGSVYLQQNETEEALAAYQMAEENGGPLSKKMGMHYVQALAYLRLQAWIYTRLYRQT